MARKPHIASSDAALGVLLGLFVAAVLLIGLPEEYRALEEALFSILFTAIFAAGAAVIALSGRSAVIVIIVAVAAACLRWTSYYSGSRDLYLADAAGSFIFFLLIMSALIRRVFDRSDVTRQKLLGAIALYLLLGFIWSRLYAFIMLASPGAFQFQRPPETLVALYQQLAYFSFVTITTTGYGDILPLHSFAQSVAILESCVGVLFPSILLARLVSLEIMHSGKGRG